MPLPKPKSNEKRNVFVNRCVSILSEDGEFEDRKQRVAVCYDIYNESKKNSNASVIVEYDDGDEQIIHQNNQKN